MADYYFDETTPLTAGPDSALLLAEAGTAFIGRSISNKTGKAIQAAATQDILIAAGMMINGSTIAVNFLGSGSSLNNQGAIYSVSGNAILFSGGGTNFVTNLGSIVATDGIKIAVSESAIDNLDLFNSGSIIVSNVAVTGGYGDDRIVNNGTLRTTGAVLLDLGHGNDLYDGSSGAAFGKIVLGEGNDTAYGGVGADILSGGAGDDSLDGGGGLDTADYADATSGITVNLGSTTWQTIGGGHGQDLLVNIENVTGGNSGDTLTGNNSDNILSGGKGNDTLDGGLGNDVLNGGDDEDTVRYNGSSGAAVDLSITSAQNTIGYGWDLLTGIENLEGSYGADTLTGNAFANKLSGSYGDDVLKGGGGDDTLDGSVGNDTAVFTGKSTEYTFPAQADDSTTFTVTDTVAGRDGTDSLKDIRLLRFLGDNTTIALHNDAPTNVSMSSSSVKESTTPSSFVAYLSGSDPNGDSLTYTLLDSAGGRFKLESSLLTLQAPLDYETATAHTIRVKAEDAYGKSFVKDLTITVQNVVENTPVVRYGTAAGEAVSGENGNDKVYGLDSNDTLWGGNGDDTLYGGSGNDYLLGQAGRDIFVFDSKPNIRTNIDNVYDFNPVDDTIHLAKSAFSKIAKGSLSKKAFVKGDHFKDASDRILYHKAAGALFYDPDGTGKAKAVQIAAIGKDLAITHKDFFIV